MKKKFSRLKEMRNSLSLKEMEKLTGIPATTIDRAERGGADLKASVLVAYQTVFGVTTDYLLGLSDERTPPRAAGSNNSSASGAGAVNAPGGISGTVNIHNGGDAKPSIDELSEQIKALSAAFEAQAATLKEQGKETNNKIDFVKATVDKVVAPHYAEMDLARLAARLDEIEQNVLRMQNRSERRRECAYKGDIEEIKRRLPDAQSDGASR
jgi:transcriptional regulator with XRE-family HTH domain